MNIALIAHETAIYQSARTGQRLALLMCQDHELFKGLLR